MKFIYAYCVVITFNLVISQELDSGDAYEDGNMRIVGRAYSISTCDYRTQLGYTCIACNRALHCYPGNAAIVVDCYGPFRYCRDGRCSRFQGDKCFPDNKITTQSTLISHQNTSVTNVDVNAIADQASTLGPLPLINNEAIANSSPSPDNSTVERN